MTGATLERTRKPLHPTGVIHRMENPGKVPMVLIEVQTGADAGANGIMRYEENYA